MGSSNQRESGSDRKVGSCSQPLDLKSLDNQTKQIDKMVREIPEYRDAVLIEVKTQVVAGIMYHLVYESKSVKHLVKVWSQPWKNKFLQITLDNGKKIVKGGTV